MTIIFERSTEKFIGQLKVSYYLLILTLWKEGITFFVFFLLCVFTFWLPCCDVRYDFNMITMLDSSLSPVVYRRTHVLFTLFVFVCIKWCPTHIVLCFDLFVIVLCTLCCQVLWIVHFWLPHRYSIAFIYWNDLQIKQYQTKRTITSHLNLTHWTQYILRHMTLGIQILASDRHNNVAECNIIIGNPLLITEPPMTIHI